MCFFFFFKQKTAYEMRISDWSSDVCSSDLREDVDALQPAVARVVEHLAHGGAGDHPAHRDVDLGLEHGSLEDRRFQAVAGLAAAEVQADGPVAVTRAGGRSEEHTSELQSLMRISYAVFCLKKKKHKEHNKTKTRRQTRKGT